jgi:glyoxylase-like metal-dependent hydrolase (beta-lactamase superfamily II)
MKSLPTGLFIIWVFATLPLSAQQFEYSIDSREIVPGIHMLVCDAGGYKVTAVALTGPDGLLMVDTGFKQLAPAFRMQVEAFGLGAPKIIINTHTHVDHTGCNALFGKEALVIAHDTVRTRMRNGRYVLEEYPDEALPDVTFADSLTVHFNSEEIRIIAIPGSHDDSDAIVHFRKAGVVFMSDLYYGKSFPTVDGEYGNAVTYPEALDRAMELLPDHVRLIPGHGTYVGTMDDLREYRDMLNRTITIVRKGYKKGKSVEALQQAQVLRDWEQWSEPEYATTDYWIMAVSRSLDQQKHGAKKSLAEPLYHALKEGDAETAIARYYELKERSPDQYNFTAGGLYNVAFNYLLEKERNEEAIKLFQLLIAEYPDVSYLWAIHDTLGEIYKNMGQREQAIAHYERVLELRPDDTNAVAMLKELREETGGE